MTDKEKARAYDEALERARKRIMVEPQDHTDKILKDIFPQLAESEDERIRKFLIDILSHGTWRKEWPFGPNEVVAYLEKQKDNQYFIGYANGYSDGQLNPKQKEPNYTKRNELFDKCVENCDPKVMKEVSDNVDKMLEPKIAFGDWGDKEKKEAISTCLKYMRFIKKITNQEYDDLTEWLNDNLVSNVLLKKKQKEHQKKSDAQEKALGRDLTFPQDKDKNLDEIAQDYVERVKEYNPEPTWNLMQTAVCYGYHCCEQKEQKQEWKPQPESLEALMYAIEGKWDMILPTSYLSRRLEDLYEGLVNTFNIDESFLAELPKVASLAYTAEDIEELKELKRKIEASMEQKQVPISCSHENGIPAEHKATINGEPIQTENQSVDIPLAEWSEEDEKIAKEIEEELWYPGDFPDYPSKEESELYDDCQRRLNWFKNKLKSLRPQPKQEWSDEDENMRNLIIETLDDNSHYFPFKETKKKMMDWLKSLRPQSHWKPSEEQMTNLLRAEGRLRIEGENVLAGKLAEIYEQLKKL